MTSKDTAAIVIIVLTVIILLNIIYLYLWYCGCFGRIRPKTDSEDLEMNAGNQGSVNSPTIEHPARTRSNAFSIPRTLSGTMDPQPLQDTPSLRRSSATMAAEPYFRSANTLHLPVVSPGRIDDEVGPLPPMPRAPPLAYMREDNELIPKLDLCE
ncbi:hypothetical protein P280DRAFT_484588 [Massarina eburnea CBS 473.64]|uniref:Uncharacterized protein n=1 Tax=Massarina eburnea CBS 473.64 TaxID=1395130 RepID=A0A6A6RN17_9PLEO|nr:hypothetical protein P280DRAFT_484588 [Massarina eburnea CBS 473.64]